VVLWPSGHSKLIVERRRPTISFGIGMSAEMLAPDGIAGPRWRGYRPRRRK